MNKYLSHVKLFHKTFDHPVQENPCIPKDRVDLRIELIEEELKELKDAIKDGDLVEVADALADIQYVLGGAVLEFGFGDRFDSIYDEVQRSNMSKASKTKEIAEKTSEHYLITKGTESYVKQLSNGEWGTFRSSDHKLLKSIEYSKANLNQFVK